MLQKLDKLRASLTWLARESRVNPAAEGVYRHLFLRDIARAGIDDVFYPVGSAANYSLLYLVWRCLRDLPVARVLELGAGQTTLLLDRARDALGARYEVRTIEHDAFWAEAVAANVAHEIVQAPLLPTRVGDREIAYYDIARVLADGETFDLVIVDGPPAATPETQASRIGCVTLLERGLAEDFVVILDDAERAGEAAAVDACRDLLRRQGREFRETVVAAAKRQHVFASERFRAAVFF